MERFSAANNSNKRQRGSDDDGSDDSSVARLSKQQSDSVAKIFKASQCHQLHEKEVQMAESVMRTPIGGQNFADVLSSVLKSSKSGGLKVFFLLFFLLTCGSLLLFFFPSPMASTRDPLARTAPTLPPRPEIQWTSTVISSGPPEERK